MQGVQSINPVVGETNDGTLNAIRSRPIRFEHVAAALDNAQAGAVEEGAVGAGAGTVAFGFKGGIGTSSRVLPVAQGGYTVGVLVQSNFGGVLQVLGAPVGKELGRYAFRNDGDHEQGDGSIMIVVATNAPLSDRNLERLAARAIMGLSRTGSSASNGSGDYVLAFSTSPMVRRRVRQGAGEPAVPPVRQVEDLGNDAMSALFQGVVEATEEAIYNSLFKATTVTSRGRTIEALPLDRLREILRKYNVSNR
jgi:D-aminopeptidase